MDALHVHAERDDDGRLVATIIGEVDLGCVEEFAEAIAADCGRTDIADLRFVTFLDAAGTSVLVRAAERHPLRILASTAVERVVAAAGAADALALDEPAGPPRLDLAPFGVAVHDDDLRWSYVNGALARINGAPVDQHLGHLPSELFAVASDPIGPLLDEVLTTGIARRIVLDGSTADAVGRGPWTCTYRRVEYRVDGVPVRKLVALVDVGLESGVDLSPELVAFDTASGTETLA